MHISKQELQQIILEETQAVLNEWRWPWQGEKLFAFGAKLAGGRDAINKAKKYAKGAAAENPDQFYGALPVPAYAAWVKDILEKALKQRAARARKPPRPRKMITMCEGKRFMCNGAPAGKCGSTEWAASIILGKCYKGRGMPGACWRENTAAARKC